MEKHNEFSEKQFNDVWAWCEENKETALARTYLNACLAVSDLDGLDVFDQLSESSEGINMDFLNEASDLLDMAFDYRDVIFWMIIGIIKRKAK